MPEPMLLVDFPGGGHLSIEFIEDAPDEDRRRLGAWLELRVDDPAIAMRSALEAVLTEITHPGHHPSYLMAPGSQVFTIAPTSERGGPAPRPTASNADARFAAVVDAFRDEPGVSLPSDGKGFGSSGLRVPGKICVMLSSGQQLVSKLPADRVDALLASGDGERYDPGHGRLMKEWVALKPSSSMGRLPLAREGLEFVSGARTSGKAER